MLGKPRDFSERTTGSRVTLVDEEGGAWGYAVRSGGGRGENGRVTLWDRREKAWLCLYTEKVQQKDR